MSYQIIVTSSDGALTVTATGDVPDGFHLVSGHEDASYVNLSATRQTPEHSDVLVCSAQTRKGA